MKVLVTKLTAHITPESLQTLYSRYKGLIYEFRNRTQTPSLIAVKHEETTLQKFLNEEKYHDAKLLFCTLVSAALAEMQMITNGF